MKSQMSLKMGHVGSKTKSLSQILEKPCVCSRGHIFSPIIMKLNYDYYRLAFSQRRCTRMYSMQ